MLTADKKLKALSQKLLEFSLEDGRVSEPRVQSILQSLAAKPPKNHRTLLKLFLHAVQKELSRSEALVEYAGALDPSTVESVESKLTALNGRPISTRLQENPDLIAGIRVTLADNVYDTSITAQLGNLSKTVT